ncbi:DUF7677 family protein [Vallitalea maricola]|uniref:Uncharacterized protein n=1 Tax=Vallitalea maricola TaxID=3074433 RepID=A0ACB5ULI5_9FIRM|nr:hypothetical protein AN2V17_30650 [Vallitalea sp. AN17-2]
MELKGINQLDEDDRSPVRHYAFLIANGTLILRYSDIDYRKYLINNPEYLVKLFAIYFTQNNWGYEDKRFFKYYDEQWLATICDEDFKTELSFNQEYFSYKNHLPWQRAVVDFTNQLITCSDEAIPLKPQEILNTMLQTGTPFEQVYAVLVNTMDINPITGEVGNKEHATNRAFDMLKRYIISDYKPIEPFKEWEIELVWGGQVM